MVGRALAFDTTNTVSSTNKEYQLHCCKKQLQPNIHALYDGLENNLDNFYQRILQHPILSITWSSINPLKDWRKLAEMCSKEDCYLLSPILRSYRKD
jgi:hypothetical protein